MARATFRCYRFGNPAIHTDEEVLSLDSTMMSIFGVGVSLAAILVVSLRSLRTEIVAVETRLRGEINAVETRLGNRIDRLADRLDGLAAPRGVPLPTPTPDESPA